MNAPVMRVCAWCPKWWNRLAQRISKLLHVKLSHGICPRHLRQVEAQA